MFLRPTPSTESTVLNRNLSPPWRGLKRPGRSAGQDGPGQAVDILSCTNHWFMVHASMTFLFFALRLQEPKGCNEADVNATNSRICITLAAELLSPRSTLPALPLPGHCAKAEGASKNEVVWFCRQVIRTVPCLLGVCNRLVVICCVVRLHFNHPQRKRRGTTRRNVNATNSRICITLAADFLARKRELRKQYGVTHADVPSALVFKRDMTVLPWPSSTYKTLQEIASGTQRNLASASHG